LEVLAKKFDRFGWERDRGSAAHDRMVTDWMDALQEYPLDEVRAACRDAVRESPNRMPNEGHICALILTGRKRFVEARAVQQEPEPERKPVDKATASAIIAAAGYQVRRMA
jgi:hypothetical protein